MNNESGDPPVGNTTPLTLDALQTLALDNPDALIEAIRSEMKPPHITRKQHKSCNKCVALGCGTKPFSYSCYLQHEITYNPAKMMYPAPVGECGHPNTHDDLLSIRFCGYKTVT